MFYLTLIVFSFALALMFHHPEFYLSLLVIHLVSQHWDSILGSV